MANQENKIPVTPDKSIAAIPVRHFTGGGEFNPKTGNWVWTPATLALKEILRNIVINGQSTTHFQS